MGLSFSDSVSTVKIGNSTVVYALRPLDPRTVKLYSIRTPVAHRGNGEARTAMTAFLAAVDRAGLSVTLDASPLDKKTSRDKLISFYESFGFVVTGERINPLGDPAMIRKARRQRGH
jgi:ribosomal protein S18 acetylase RimI-like enzyme